MRRTEVLQGLREMKFEEIHDRFRRGRLSTLEASEWLRISERTFLRWRGRYEAEGPCGLADRRLGKLKLQIEPSPLRPHFVRATVQVRRYRDDTIALFYGHRCIGRYQADGTAFDTDQQAA